MQIIDLSRILVVATLGLAGALPPLNAAPAVITVEVKQPGHKVPATFYGAFFEEISRGGEGGLYGQMLQNGSFEESVNEIAYWKTTLSSSRGLRGVLSRSHKSINEITAWKQVGTAEAGLIALDRTSPLNEVNPTTLCIDAKNGFTGAVSDGFLRWNEETKLELPDSGVGLHVEAGHTYLASVFARGEGTLVAQIRSHNDQVIAESRFAAIGSVWKKLEVELVPSATQRDARFVIGLQSPGKVWIDMASLFPKDTFKGRPNGMRKDLAQILADLKTPVLRFPGGCFVEGDVLEMSDRWKWTVGPLEKRQGHASRWGYYSSGGLGYHEYLQFCEDIGAEPMFCINAGMAHEEIVPLDRMTKSGWIQDALDAIEYANGPATSKWGALRAAAGHPEPFGMIYIEIGNENFKEEYRTRFEMFRKAIKEKYPEMIVIANNVGGHYDWPLKNPPDMIDCHKYGDTYYERIAKGIHQFDNYPRRYPKVFVGEFSWGRRGPAGLGNLRAACADAAYLLGLERNCDVVTITAYAPLMCHLDFQCWQPNLIHFDQSSCYGTPTYHVQKLFQENRIDQLVATIVDGAPQIVDQPKPTKDGKPAPKPATADGLIVNAGRTADGAWVIKVVNGSDQATDGEIRLSGMTGTLNGKAWTITSQKPEDENLLSEPQKISPREESLGVVPASGFQHSFPAFSVNVFRLTAK